MIQKKYDVLVRNGKEQFVVVPKEDYEALIERLADDEDHRILQEAKKRNAGTPLIPHEQVMRELGLKSFAKKKRKS